MLVPLPGGQAATQGLFYFDSFRQRVELDYKYRGLTLSEQGSEATRSVRHRFEETYRADINYVLIGPNLLFGGAGFEAALNQMNSSISGISSHRDATDGGTRLLYNIYGTFLRYHPVSVSFSSNSNMNHVTREFAQNYDQTVYSNNVSLHVKSKMIPFNVDYRQTKTDTDGLVSDYTRENNSLVIDARHSVGRISETFLNLRFDDYRTNYSNELADYELQSSRLLLTNDLTWYSGENTRKLSSRGSYVEEEGTTALQGYDWSENLDWHFGRALIGTLYYNQTYTDRVLNDLERNQGRATLRHQFLECIDSQIGLELRNTIQTDGEEHDRSGDISFAYRKKLPGESTLHTNFYFGYGIVDRDLNSFTQTVLDEAHTADTIIPIILDRQNAVSGGVVVRNANPADRLEPYERDVDYQVDQVGMTTLLSILPGSDIVDGTNLLIDYNYLDNAEERYEYTNRRISISLNWRKTYRLYGRWEESFRSHLSGEDLFSNSNSRLREAVLGLDGSLQRSSFGLEYNNRKAHYENRQSLKTFYQWSQRVQKGVLTSGLGNYYASISPTVGSNDYWTNTMSVNTKYQTPVFRRGSLGLFAKYANTQSDVKDRDDITVGFAYRHGYGKFIMTFDAKVDWRFIDNQERREETVNLRLIRYL